MAGTEIVLDDREFHRLLTRLRSFRRRVSQPKELLSVVAGTLESQARKRLQETKTAPNGSPWRRWSSKYAAKRGPQHSLLVGTGHLLDSISSDSTNTQVRVFTDLVYGRTHQEGRSAANIPARPFFGLGVHDAREIEDVCDDWLRRAL